LDLGPLVGKKRVFRTREWIWRFGCSWTEDAAAAAPKYIVLGVADA